MHNLQATALLTTQQAAALITISAAVLFGVVLALLGSLKLALARHLNIGEGRVGGLIAALNLALIPMMLFCGVLLDVLGIKLILVGGSFVTSLALFTIGFSPTYRRALFATFLAGLGAAALCTGALVMMTDSFFMRPGGNISPGLNLGHVFIALGALITPALVDVLRYVISFRWTMILLALLALAPGILCLLPDPFSQALASREIGNQGQRAFPLFTNQDIGHLGLAALVFFFYAPLEAAISVWTTTYLTENGAGESEAAFMLSGFWGSFLLSRLLVAFMQAPPWLDPWLVVIPTLGAAAMLGNLTSTVSGQLQRFGLLMLGFCLGPIFPSLLGIVFREFPTERGTAHGVIFAVGSSAGLLLGPLMGLRLQKGAQSFFTIPLILSIGLLLASVVFGLTVGTGGRP